MKGPLEEIDVEAELKPSLPSSDQSMSEPTSEKSQIDVV